IREGDAPPGQVHTHRVPWGERDRFPPETLQGSLLARIRGCWRTRNSKQCRGLEAAVEAALPATMVAVPGTGVRIDRQAGIRALAARGRAMRAGDAHLASRAIWKRDTEVGPGPHGYALRKPRQRCTTIFPRHIASEGRQARMAPRR